MDQGSSIFQLSQLHSSYGGTHTDSHPSELHRLQETNEALSYDVKGILDNKMRVENENFLLKKEI